MPFLFMESFDDSNDVDEINDKKWNSATTTGLSLETTSPRTGINSLKSISASENVIGLTKTISTTYFGPGTSNFSKAIIGVAMYLPTGGTSFRYLLEFLQSGIYGIRLETGSTGDDATRLRAYRYSYGWIAASDTGVVPYDQWFYLEMYIYSHGTNGVIEVHINGQNVFSASGINTNPVAGSGEGYFNSFKIYLPYQNCMMDDVYAYVGGVHVADDITPSNIIGDCRIETLFPNADGTYLQWATSSGTEHYSLINDPYLTTSPTKYVYTSTEFLRDSYEFENLTIDAGEEIIAIQENLVGYDQFPAQDYIHGIVVRDSVVASGENYRYWFNDITGMRSSALPYINDPITTSGWDVTDLNNTEFGLEYENWL